MGHLIHSIEQIVPVASAFLKNFPGGGVFGLHGDLGVGKTAFVREVIGQLYERAGQRAPRVASPSYVLHQLYEVSPPVDHFDLYRLAQTDDAALLEIGFFEALDRAEKARGYVFVEWPERLPPHQKYERLEFTFEGMSRRIAWAAPNV